MILRVLTSLWACRLTRLVLGAVFIYAGATKISDPAAFAKVIAAYEILPDVLVSPTAHALPWIEIIAGAATVFGSRLGLSATTLMTLMFIGAVSYAITAGLDINDCGCFSTEDAEILALTGEAPAEPQGDPQLWNTLWRDIGLLLLCLHNWIAPLVRPRENRIILPR